MEIVPDYEYYRSGHHQRMEIVPKTQYSSAHQSGMDIRSVADIDGELARVESRELRRNIEAWVRMEKTKGENKAIKKRSKLEAWEIEMKADARERFERKRAEWFEKLQNELAEIDTYVAGERAMIDAEQEKKNLHINNKAAKYLSHGYLPKKFLSFFRFRG